MKHYLSLLVMVFLSVISYSQTKVVDLGLSVNWSSENIGASATNIHGDKYAWGEVIPKKDFTQENYLLEYDDGGNSIEGSAYDVAAKTLKQDWRVPTEKEILELCQQCRWEWGTSKGVSGYYVTGPSGATIFLPVESNDVALYWSGTLSRGLGRTSIALELNKDRYFTWGTYKFQGGFIRPVCNNPNYKAYINAYINAPADWQDEKYSELLKAISEEDYETAYEYATFLSSAGDVKATYLLSTMSMCGVGGPQNYENSIYSLVELARDGDERAQYMLGGYGSLLKQREMMRLFLGEDAENNDNAFWFQMMGVDEKSQSFKDCLKWFFTPLEEIAYRDIMFYAGLFCLNGQFGFEAVEHGVLWLQKSAAKGYPDAIKVLEQLQNNE